MLLGLQVEPGDDGAEGGVGSNLGGVEEEFLAPEQPRLLTQRDDVLEEPLEDWQAQPPPNAGQTGVVGQRFVERIAEVPAVSEVEASSVHQAPLGAEALEEHDELELEEHDRVDRRPAAFRIAVRHPLAHKRKVEGSVEVPVEMVGRHQAFQGDRDRLVQRAAFGWPEHR
jgi:hypothetical protein